ncbi:MAG: O-antigen ligase family protein [Candidatus Nanopelagicaceae bacterium]|nr:O-antigen ligase family protein [Candidatus Nanopelagicaceae bacterium]
MISLSKEQAQKTRRLLLITGTLVTFAFWFPLSDPMNIPKMFVLLTLSAWIFASLAVAFIYKRPKKLDPFHWSLLAFVIGMLLAALLTDVRYTAFVGAAYRNNGALSYIALAGIAFAAAISFDFKSLSQLRTSLLIVGAVSSFYGLLQTTGRDPFDWKNLFGPVVGTVGNPDFFSALVGVCAIATVWFVLKEENLKLRVSGGVLLLVELFIVKRSGSFQGLLAFAIGASLLLLVWIWQFQRRYGLVSIISVSFVGVFVLLGIINQGPLASLIYRASLKNRMDYWRAAFEMFKAHPVAGVGLERFAENYPHFAPKIQVAQGVNSDNAHNVILQLLATGGLIVTISYLILIGLVFQAGIQAIRSSNSATRINIAALFSIWFALLLISLVSVDNLGQTIWFWIFSGALYAISTTEAPERSHSVDHRKVKGKKFKRVPQDNSTYLSPVVSALLAIVVFVLLVPIVRTSGTLYNLSGNKENYSREQFTAKLKEVGQSFPRNSQTLTTLADLSLRASDSTLALQLTRSILEKDPKSLMGNLLSASAYELSKKYELAIPYRQRLMELDPWDAKNMLEIVRDYVALKDLLNAKAMVEKIVQLHPAGGEDVAAAALVKG